MKYAIQSRGRSVRYPTIAAVSARHDVFANRQLWNGDLLTLQAPNQNCMDICDMSESTQTTRARASPAPSINYPRNGVVASKVPSAVVSQDVHAENQLLTLAFRGVNKNIAVRLWHSTSLVLRLPCLVTTDPSFTLVVRNLNVVSAMIVRGDPLYFAEAYFCGDIEIADVESLRRHYALTLRHWVARLEQHHVQAMTHVSESTYRVWRLYMAACALDFEAGELGIYQVLANKRTPGYAPTPLTRRHLYCE